MNNNPHESEMNRISERWVHAIFSRHSQARVSWQQSGLAQQALCGLWLAHELAPPLGQELG
jgi:hypothetical protein